MKAYLLVAITILTVIWDQTGSAIAQSFSGTNAPGESRAINFTVPPGVTNISLYVSNSPTAFSHLFLKQGATPSETDYDFSSQLDGHYNDINIEVPELVPTDYVLLVLTPTNSLTHEFVVELRTNLPPLRSAEIVVSKPQVATITGDFYKENFPFHYFRFEIPSNSPGWRLVLTTTGTNPASLYVLKDAAPQTWSYYRAAIDQTNGTVVLTDTEATPGVWYVGVTHPLDGPVVYTLRSETNYLAGTVVWDPGSTCAGETWFTNASATGGDYYFKVRPVDATNGAWRTVLRTVSGEADLYLAQGSLPSTISSHRASTRPGAGIDEVILYGGEFDTNQDWFILVHATPGAQWRLLTGNIHIETLDWDLGLTSHGTSVYTNDCDDGLSFFFKITAQNTEISAWRTALNVQSGEADVLMRYADLPRPGQANYFSQRVGSDGFVLHSSQFSAAQDWYLLVRATEGAQWNLVSGEAFAHDLGALADDESSSTNVTIGAEGMAFFKTTVDADTLAWSLWLHGATNELRVRISSAPHPVSYAGGEPLPQSGQMLVVPAYLAAGSFNGYYFVNVPGTPGEGVSLDSRKHAVADIDFNSTNSPVIVSNWGYRSYRVQVPVQQIAWQVSVVPVSGNPNFAVRRDTVPNEWNNDAFSEVGSGVIDSVTLVPPALSDGTFFITVYGDAPFSFVLRSGTPLVTDVPFLGASTNGELGRVGWRYFRVTDIESQLGYLGWDLLLQSAPPGTEIAMRRNAVPGRWNSRLNNSTYVGGNGYVDFSSTSGELQRPGHQADIWYIGVYNPSSALNAFRLLRQLLTPENAAFESSTSRSDVPPEHWEYFQIEVPTSVAGWDVRLVNVTQGNPRMVVRRDLLPDGLQNGPYPYPWAGYWWYDLPWVYGSWPSGSQWVSGGDWTDAPYTPEGADAHVNTLAMGAGNPLEPGTYYVGVYAGGVSSYTLRSRGIGSGLTIPVHELAYSGAGASHTNTLPAREAAYYRVDIASNAPSWKVKLSPTSGEALLLVQKGALPNVTSGSSALPASGLPHTGGKKMRKADDEHYVLLPASGETSIPPGTYYLAVVSQGVNPQNNLIGEGDTDFVLESLGALAVTNLGTVTYGHDLTVNHALGGGEVAAYRFVVPPNTPVMEVRLEDRVGNPAMTLAAQVAWASAPDSYGAEGGTGGAVSANLFSLPNPATGVWSVAVQAAYPYADASYTLRVTQPPTPDLNFTASLNTNGSTNAFSGLLADNQRTHFRVEVPAMSGGMPVIGWRLDLVLRQGAASARVRKDLLPADDGIPGTSHYSSPTTCIVPPYLTPGVWYVEVLGAGATDFTLVSSALLTERTWTMPAPGQPTTTQGLTAPEFGDTGTETNGNPVLDPQTGMVTDRGVDLEQGRFHYYAVVVPQNNTGVLRTWLEAISGNPDLYIRAGAPPTLSHGPCTYWWCPATLFDRAQTGTTTDYGNWVSLNGRYETGLTPGVWYLAVQAAGNANVRYRLHLSNGAIQDLPLNGGGYTGQIQAGGDWRYYRVQIPSNAPANWNVTFSQQAGDVVMYLRDTIPPGFGAGPGYYYDWASDQKNYGPHPSYDLPGTYALAVPPVRPGHTYYLGFRAVNDAVFSVSSSTSGGMFSGTNVLAFYGGYVTNVLPPFGSALFRVNVPEDAVRWRSQTVRGPEVAAYLEQGTIPIPGLSHLGNAESWWNGFWNIYLLTPNNWPWVPAQSYFLLITNTSAMDQPFSLRMDGRNLLSDDEDADGLPDYWEIPFFSSIWAQNSDGDADGDGFSNIQEYLADTDPTDATSYLRITGLSLVPGGVRLEWRGGIRSTQYLQRHPTLDGSEGPWQDVFTNPPPTTTTNSFIAPFGTNSLEFYRVRAQRP